MKVIIIITGCILAGWLLVHGLGVLSVLIAVAIGIVIKNDKPDKMINDFFGLCFGLCLVGIALWLFGF